MDEHADAALPCAAMRQPYQQLPIWPEPASPTPDQLSWRRHLDHIRHITTRPAALQHAGSARTDRIATPSAGHLHPDVEAEQSEARIAAHSGARPRLAPSPLSAQQPISSRPR
ncbi:hypothetical protein [Nonomuraea sp. NPDC050202]|jgi:hypothetical protein|uniref:hypothetical protein n=1 Tax=Nonomuraea sp. NPDC050202 TaxID=3155035 RepID=UPI0033C191E0